MNPTFPLQYVRGRTALSSEADLVYEMIEQVLFTHPGERRNRPEFGCGLRRTVFEPNSETLAAALQASIQTELQRWLGHLIQVRNLEVRGDDATLRIALNYVLLRTGELRSADFLDRSV
jgi:phage baseplate assembly protein W